MIYFKATTQRTFKTRRAFEEFMRYFKSAGGVTPEIVDDLITKGSATRTDTTELENEVTTTSKWTVLDEGNTP